MKQKFIICTQQLEMNKLLIVVYSKSYTISHLYRGWKIVEEGETNIQTILSKVMVVGGSNNRWEYHLKIWLLYKNAHKPWEGKPPLTYP